MSSIRIECRKDKYHERKDKDLYKSDSKNTLGNELIIEANQLFMNTESFFNSVKESLGNYFDTIKKK